MSVAFIVADVMEGEPPQVKLVGCEHAVPMSGLVLPEQISTTIPFMVAVWATLNVTVYDTPVAPVAEFANCIDLLCSWAAWLVALSTTGTTKANPNNKAAAICAGLFVKAIGLAMLFLLFIVFLVFNLS